MGTGIDDRQSEAQPAESSIAKWVARAKRHPVIVVIGVLVAVITVLAKLSQGIALGGDALDALDNWRHPYAREYAKLAAIDLGMSRPTIDEKLGTSTRLVDVCAEAAPLCVHAPAGDLELAYYESEQRTVRALFDEGTLRMYAVTLTSTSDFALPMRWLGHELGNLGEADYQQALAPTAVAPTDAAVFMGPQSSAYVEIVAAGAPADYRGLLLANLPSGRGDLAFDAQAGRALVRDDIAGGAFDRSVHEQFRSGSVPNTFGEFRDDGGWISALVANGRADQLIPLLYLGTEP